MSDKIESRPRAAFLCPASAPQQRIQALYRPAVLRGDGRLDDDPKLVVEVMMAIGGRMSGTPLDEKARPVVEAMAKREDRVVIRCRPYETFAQPPRHLHRNDQEEEITHWISASMPWDVADEGPA
jgi:hypothetical protein